MQNRLGLRGNSPIIAVVTMSSAMSHFIFKKVDWSMHTTLPRLKIGVADATVVIQLFLLLHFLQMSVRSDTYGLDAVFTLFLQGLG